MNDMKPMELILLAKYGFDGSSGHSMYHQKPQCVKSSNGSKLSKPMKPSQHGAIPKQTKKSKSQCLIQDDSHLVATQLAVIWIVWGNRVIYLNELMNSPAGHRPLRMRYGKETRESSQEEWQRLETEIRQLVSFVPMQGVKVNFRLVPTLFDTKAVDDIMDIRYHARFVYN